MVEDGTFRDSTERKLKGMATVKALEEPMAVIRDLCKERSVVFPPINHENLPVPWIPRREQDEQSSICLSPMSSLGLTSSSSNSSISSTSSFSPLDVDDLGPPASERGRHQIRTREPSQVNWWWRICLGVLQSKVVGSVSSIGCKVTSRVTLWSMFPAAVAAFWVVYLRFRLSMRIRRRPREDTLLLIVKEQEKVCGPQLFIKMLIRENVAQTWL